MNLLIAEDNRIIQNILYKLIKDNTQSQEIYFSQDAKQEINIIEQYNPDIVITDIIKNGECSGLEIIKDYNNKKESPIFIIISGLEMTSEIKKLKLSNVWACIQKPFSNENVINKLLELEEYMLRQKRGL